MSSDRSSRDGELERKKREQLGLEEEHGEELFQDNREYLRAMSTLGRKIIREARFLTDYPSKERFGEKREEFSEEFEELEEKRRRSEEEHGVIFESTKFLDDEELDETGKLLLKLLYAQKGIGYQTLDSDLSGEVLMHAAVLTSDEEVEEVRSHLTPSSRLMSDKYIGDKLKRGMMKRSGKGDNRDVENLNFYIERSTVDSMLGDGLGSREEKSRKRKRWGKRKGKGKEDIFSPVDSDTTLSDVVLPEDLREDLEVLLTEKKNEKILIDEWNVLDRSGLNILFSGPPGTGKTMTAKALGNHLDMDLYLVSFQELVNEWYGETEKNVDRLFNELEDGESIILLDEADAVLRERTGSSRGSDSTENRMVNIFLQRMEDHSGIVVLTTNYAGGLDKGLERRLDRKLEFPKPDANAREDIWRYHLSDELPLDDDVDVVEMAEKYKFTGGEIRNVVCNAARRAVHEEREVVLKKDFEKACRAEKKGERAMNYSLQDEEDEDKVRRYR